MADAVLLPRWRFRCLVLSGYHELSTGARCFLVAVDNHRSAQAPQPFPGQELLGCECGCSVDSIARYFREAKAAGWIEKVDRGSSQSGRLSPAYNLTVPESVIGVWEADSGVSHLRNLRSSATPQSVDSQGRNLRADIVKGIECVTALQLPTRRTGRQPKTGLDDPVFCEAISAYPRRVGGDPRHLAWQSWHASLVRGEDPQAILAGVRRYRRYCEAAGKLGTERVMQMRRFFGLGREWDQPWELPLAEERPVYVPAPPPAPREPMVSPQQLGDILQRAAGHAVPERRYLSNRKPYLLLRGVTYLFGADVPPALVTANLLMAECVIPAPLLPTEESAT